MVLYTEADFDKINEAHERNKNLNSGKKDKKLTNKTFDHINDAGCKDSSLQELIKTVNNLAKVQNDNYNERQKDKYNKEQIEKRKKSITTVNYYLNTLIIENTKTTNELNTLISDYANKQKYTSNMKDLYGVHIKETSNLQKKIDDYIGYIQTDNRKSFYENQEINFSNKIKKNITYIYYILLLVYLWYGGFFQNELYKNYYVLFIIFIYILIPYILKYLVIYLFYLWKQFYYSFINTNDYNKKWYIKRE